MNKKNNAGFTLLEVLVGIAILTVLATIVVSGIISFQKSSDLDNSVREFVGAIKLAQNKTLSSEDYNQYGVYINTGVSPNQYVLFEGTSYASKIKVSQTYSLPVALEFYGISLGGGNEIVFERLTGISKESGNVSIRNKSEPAQLRTVYIASSGTIGFSPPTAMPDDNRVTDSRHAQFVYSRTIDINNENIALIFDGYKTETIPISLYSTTGEFQWSGTISVGGSNQTVEISTLRLNNPDTLFSIRRDRRYNDKSLKITISGDSSGSLVEYSADGATTIHPSIYVSDFSLQ